MFGPKYGILSPLQRTEFTNGCKHFALYVLNYIKVFISLCKQFGYPKG